jgi:hypothetical protein
VLDSPTRSHSQNSILHSPFESDASQGSFHFSGSLDVGAEDAAAQATALPGAPALPAGTPLNSQAPAGSQDVAALAGEPTMLAAVALGSPAWQQQQAQQQQAQQQQQQQQYLQQQDQQQQRHAEQQAAPSSTELPAAASGSSEPAAVGPHPKEDASSAPASSASALEEAADGSERIPMPMHPLCPLYDSLLPLETASIKTQQMAHSLQLLEAVSEEGEYLPACVQINVGTSGASAACLAAPDALTRTPALHFGSLAAYSPRPWPSILLPADAGMNQLEAIARLTWSDDAARAELGERGGLAAIVACMLRFAGSEAVQCNGCLALMALVRGAGEASDANRRLLADSGGVQAIAQGERVGASMGMRCIVCLLHSCYERNEFQPSGLAVGCRPAAVWAQA